MQRVKFVLLKITVALECKMIRDTLQLKIKNGHSATIYPFGACVTSYKAPHEVLFVRPDAKFDGTVS